MFNGIHLLIFRGVLTDVASGFVFRFEKTSSRKVEASNHRRLIQISSTLGKYDGIFLYTLQNYPP